MKFVCGMLILQCIGSHDLYRPIASIEFHAWGELLAVASGHKVNDLDSSDCSKTLATSPGYLHYPPPTVYLADVHSSGLPCLEDELPLMSSHFLVWPSFAKDYGRTSLQPTYGGMQVWLVCNREWILLLQCGL